MEAYTLETLKLLDHVQFARANMVGAYHGGSMQNRKRELGVLKRRGLLYCPEQQKMTANYRYTPRVYAVAPLGKAMLAQYGIVPSDKIDLKNFWHQLMISDLVISLALACKQKGIPFKFQKDLIGNEPLTFPTSIAYDFPKGRKTCERKCEPDYLLAIGDKHFCLEADRGTETIMPSGFENKSHLRSILQYRDVIKTGRYKELFPNLLVLTVTTRDDHALNIMHMMLNDAKLSSAALLFTAAEILGSYDTYPEPLTYLLEAPLARVGHPDFNILKEVTNERTTR
jgi:hypothetical protein